MLVNSCFFVCRAFFLLPPLFLLGYVSGFHILALSNGFRSCVLSLRFVASDVLRVGIAWMVKT